MSDAAEVRPEVPGRGSGDLVRDPVFAPYFWGKLLANVGIWIHNIASVALVYSLSRSVLLVGLVTVALFTPQLLLVTLSGAAADRGDRRRQLLLGRLFCAAGSFALGTGVLATNSTGGLPMWFIMSASAFVGLGFTIGGPAMQALIPSLVREEELPKAVALDNFSFAIGRALGPALGGLIASGGNLAWAFGVAGIFHLVFAVIVARLPDQRGRPVATGFDASIRAGLAYVARHPTVAAILVGVAAIGVGADPALTLAPSLAAQLGGGPDLVGLFASAFGVGAFLVFFVQSWLTTRFGSSRLGSVGLVCLAGGSLGLLTGWGTGWALACFALSGAGMTLALTSLGTELYSRVPDHFRGRIMALWLLGFVGARPVAATLNGFLADRWSLQAALAVTAVGVLVAAYVARPSVLSER